jgi:hypothetical protein
MWWHSPGSVVPLRPRFQMKIVHTTRIGGAPRAHGDMKPGRSSHYGPGTGASNGDIRLNLVRGPRPSWPLRSLRPRRSRQRNRDLANRCSAGPGRQGASLARTLPSRPTGPCPVQQGSRCIARSTVEKRMEACLWSLPPASTGVAPVRCVSTANGMAEPRPNHGRCV